MKQRSVFLFSLALFFACNSQNTQFKTIQPTDFKMAYSELGGIILDVRTPQETQGGRLEDASTIDYYDINFDKKLAKLPKDKPIFVYCKSGGRSAKVASKLVQLGHQTVYNLSGGVMAWKRAGFSLVDGAAVKADKSSKTTVEVILRFIQNNENVLIDFQTQWCVPCRKLSPIVDEVEMVLSPDLKVLKVDIDKSEASADYWNIQAVPTLVHFRNGTETWRHTGLLAKEDLLNNVQ